MEETVVSKRPREAQMEKDLDFEEYSKRHKPYNQIISLLDSDQEEESTEDLSPLMTTLQQEITCASNNNPDTLLNPALEKNNQHNPTTSLEESSTLSKEEEEEDKERVMRHLLQASDDELGIPNNYTGDGLLGFGEDGLINGGDGFSSLSDELWELEDERANYYALLQSELFLWGH